MSFIRQLRTRGIHSANVMSGFQYAKVPKMVTNKLSGKVAIVTGSTAGIGYAIAKDLAENGAKIVISSRKIENVENAVTSLRKLGLDVTGRVCHVGQLEDRKNLVTETIKEHGKLDILVLNAGINPTFGPILKTSEQAWDKIFDTNVKCGFLLAQDAAPYLMETRGSMTFVSSITGYTPFPMIGAYSVSKTALLGLVKCLANELAPAGVRVNCIAPGIIKTDFSKTLTDTDGISEKILENVPLSRFGTPSDCSGAVVFLSSDAAAYITGETITITGGMSSRL